VATALEQAQLNRMSCRIEGSRGPAHRVHREERIPGADEHRDRDRSSRVGQEFVEAVFAPRTGEDGGCGEILRLEHRQREGVHGPAGDTEQVASPAVHGTIARDVIDDGADEGGAVRLHLPANRIRGIRGDQDHALALRKVRPVVEQRPPGLMRTVQEQQERRGHAGCKPVGHEQVERSIDPGERDPLVDDPACRTRRQR